MPGTARVISIVDDDASVRRALRRLIRSAGYTVDTFTSARAFLDSLPSSRTACLVLDIYLDGMNGFELEERLTTDGVAIPIIFITAHDDVETRARIARSGAVGSLEKPFDGKALLDVIATAIRGLDQGPIGAVSTKA